MVIKRINVLKLAIFQGALMAAFGLLAGLFFLMFGSMLAGLGGHGSSVGIFGGIGALVFLPIMYGIFGFIAGAIGAFIYNLVAGVVGGVEIEVE
ncbi:MAG: hypothetical protein JSS16_04070 [Proteobacteria bacterium]|nr:hypothetical protein [Pseudomonadota bacterium]